MEYNKLNQGCGQWRIQTRRLGGQSNWGAPKMSSLV